MHSISQNSASTYNQGNSTLKIMFITFCVNVSSNQYAFPFSYLIGSLYYEIVLHPFILLLHQYWQKQITRNEKASTNV